MDLSIVTTLYRSEAYVREFYTRASTAASTLTPNYEIIFVNDGSPDESLARALDLYRDDHRVRIIDLSRNFGHHRAIMTGLQHATGELVFLIDSDLEEDPGWLPEFARTLRAAGTDVVYGVQKRRKGSWFERLTGQVAYSIYHALLNQPIPRNVLTVRLMSRRYVAQLVQHRDREICLAGLWVLTGFEQLPLLVDKRNREGRSYRIRQRLSALVNAVTSFSNRPLIYIFYMGCVLIALSTSAGAFLLYRAVFHHVDVPGYVSLIMSVWFLGGVTIFCLGVIGIYLAKIFMETKDRPYTIVRAEYSHPAAGTIEDHAPLVASTERAGQSSHDSATPRPVRP
jgi:putative glycosyltransferase